MSKPAKRKRPKLKVGKRKDHIKDIEINHRVIGEVLDSPEIDLAVKHTKMDYENNLNRENVNDDDDVKEIKKTEPVTEDFFEQLKRMQEKGLI